MKQQESETIRIQEFSKRTGRKLRRAVGVRRNLGSFYLSDTADRYWRVSVCVSKRKGRYLKLEHQGTPGGAGVANVRASADNFVGPQSRRPYQFVSPAEWARFAALSTECKGQDAAAHDAEIVQARATLDRVVGTGILAEAQPPTKRMCRY